MVSQSSQNSTNRLSRIAINICWLSLKVGKIFGRMKYFFDLSRPFYVNNRLLLYIIN